MLKPYEFTGAKAVGRYPTSTLDLAMTSCFLLFQDIKLPQSLQNCLRWIVYLKANQSNLHLKNMGVTLVIIQESLTWCSFDLSIRTTPSQWLSQGDCKNWLTTLIAKEMSSRVMVRQFNFPPSLRYLQVLQIT